MYTLKLQVVYYLTGFIVSLEHKVIMLIYMASSNWFITTFNASQSVTVKGGKLYTAGLIEIL